MAETGFINNGGLVQYGEGNVSDSWDSLICKEIPTRILVSGDLPTTKSGNSMNCSFYSGTTPLFSASGTWGWQGQSSLFALKKNWKFKLKNTETENKLKVKFGNWLPMSSITTKGYGTDRTLLRDSLTTELWRNIYSTHYNGLLAPNFAYDYFKSKNCSSMTSALFSTQGFPIEIYHNKDFLGMYVIRCDNDNESYLMDDTNEDHILVQPQHASDFWVNGQYNSGEWDIYSPASPTDATTASVQRFITWAAGCINGSIDMKSTYKDYIDLKSWVDYILLCEVSASYDSIQNNFELGSWDSNIWYIYPYDEDLTFGIIYNQSTIAQTNPFTIGWVMKQKGNIGDQNPIFFEKILDTFWGEIRDRYYFLRNNGVLDATNFSKMIKKQVDLINPKSLKDDLSLWPSSGTLGALGTGDFLSDYGEKWSFVFIKNYFADRLKWLDQQFNI